jgi:hypothetical protein
LYGPSITYEDDDLVLKKKKKKKNPLKLDEKENKVKIMRNKDDYDISN